MPSQSWTAADILGLTPGVDPRRSDKFFVLNGTNYVFDSIGPRSDFGNRLLSAYPMGYPEHAQGFRLKLYTGDRIFHMTGDAILEWREAPGAWQVIYALPALTLEQPFRWTQAYLNGKQYFCHPTCGILLLDLETEVCAPLDVPGMPNTPLAIVVTNGRLCAIDESFFYFSATSDGLDWVPRLGGAGFLKISDRVSGFPIMITSYAEGAMVWTTGGVMRCQFTGDVEVFRSRALNTELRPANSFCTVKIDDETVIILDERGLFQTKGEAPIPLSPLFNEYLIKYIETYNLRIGQNLRIEWDDLQRRLYLSVSLSFESPIYESCFVLYPSVDKWGQFNEAHYAILPIRIDSGSRQDDYYGFVDTSGRVKFWNQSGSREILPTNPTLNCLHPIVQKPAANVVADLGWVASSSAGVSPVAGEPVSGVAGYFPVDGSANSPATVTGLSASVQLGLVQFGLNQSYDQLTEVTEVMLGSLITGDPTELSQGYSLAPVLDNEAFALETPNFVNCDIRIIGTMDGVSKFDESIPLITRVDRGARHYACSSTGIWHIVELKATTVGQAFRLQSLGLTAVYAGKLS